MTHQRSSFFFVLVFSNVEYDVRTFFGQQISHARRAPWVRCSYVHLLHLWTPQLRLVAMVCVSKHIRATEPRLRWSDLTCAMRAALRLLGTPQLRPFRRIGSFACGGRDGQQRESYRGSNCQAAGRGRRLCKGRVDMRLLLSRFRFGRSKRSGGEHRLQRMHASRAPFVPRSLSHL